MPIDVLILLLYALGGTLMSSVLSCVPALHIYNVAGLLVVMALRAQGFIPDEALAMWMLGMVVGYSILNTIPSIFLAAPDESAIWIVLPGQKYLMQRKGFEAAILTGVGGLGGIVFLLLLSPFAAGVFSTIRTIVAPHLHWILMLVIAYMLLSEWPKGGDRGRTGWHRLWDGWKSLLAGLVTFALFDGTKLMDVLVYGTSTGQTGWSGAAVQPWTPSTAFAESGQILYRKLDQSTGRPVADTNTAADWAQDPNDHIDGRKVQYPGWDLDEFFQTAKVTETANLVVVVAPDNAYEVIKGYVNNATTSILIEGYTFENADLIDAVVSRAQAGVTVRVLLEGGEVTDQERWFCQRLNAVGGEAYFMHNDDPADIHDRYTNQHAKFMIIDNQILVVGSENFNYSGLPVDDKTNGTWGRRGAFLITDAPGVVARAQAIFDRDLDTVHKDIVAWSPAHPRYGTPTPGFSPTYVVSDWVTYTVRFSQPLTLHDTFAFEVVQSPENSLRDADSLLGLVARAGVGDTVLVELLYEREHWGPTASTPATDPNPRLEAYIDAARRGATVRILLNGSPDTGSVSENATARDYVNGVARNEGLDLEAWLGDPAGRGIHNKMVLVQIGGKGYVHVGSINGSEISSKGNRELALQVQSDDAYDYLARVFEFDWWQAHPIHLPLVMRDYTPPPPPVDYVIISEIYYAGSVSTEWVEIYNPTEQTIDLSDYKIGDAEKADRYEGMYRFPSGTTIAPQGVLVVAFDGSQVPQADFELSNKSDTPDMIKYAAWGTGDWTLRNDGDQVLLLGPINQVVDVVLWGDETYSGVTSHPGVSVFTHSLERYPPYYDTDDCAVDFRDLFPPDPGQVSLP